MPSNLTFDYHITNMVGKAAALSAWILRIFRTRESFPLKTLLKALLVPVMEYGSVLWSPDKPGLIKVIEDIQRMFTSRFAEFNEKDPDSNLLQCNTDSWEGLRKLMNNSMEMRRERDMILFMH